MKLSQLSSGNARRGGWAMLLDAHNLSMDDVLSSSGLTANSRWFDDDPGTELTLILAFCAVILLGLLGNGLVAVLLCRNGNLRSTRHWYLLNLVVADILTCVLCMPFTLLRLTLKDWRLGQVLCRVVPFLQLTYVFVSIFTILAIAVDRYRAIVVCSTRLHLDRRRLAKLVLPAIWLLSVGLATPIAVTHRLERVHDLGGETVVLTLCVEHWESELLLGVYTVLVLLFQYAVPAVAIMALHLLICRFLRTRVHLRAMDNSRSRKKIASHRKNLALLTAISATFDMEWLPITVVNIIADFVPSVFPSAKHFCLIYSLCLLFALTSVFVNPVVYGLFNPNFRRDLGGKWARRSRGAGGGNGRDRSESIGRRCSSEATSRFYTTLLGSSGPVGKYHHGSLDAGVLSLSLLSSSPTITTTTTTTAAAASSGAGGRQRCSVDCDWNNTRSTVTTSSQDKATVNSLICRQSGGSLEDLDAPSTLLLPRSSSIEDDNDNSSNGDSHRQLLHGDHRHHNHHHHRHHNGVGNTNVSPMMSCDDNINGIANHDQYQQRRHHHHRHSHQKHTGDVSVSGLAASQRRDSSQALLIDKSLTQ